MISLPESDMEKISQQSINSNSGTAWYRRPEFWFYLTAIAGLLFRAEYLREFSAFEHFNCVVGADVQDYFDRACGILKGEVFPSRPDIHAPLYGFFLAGIYMTYRVSLTKTKRRVQELDGMASKLYSEQGDLQGIADSIGSGTEWSGNAASSYRRKLLDLISNISTLRTKINNFSDSVYEKAEEIRAEDERRANDDD